MKTIAIVGLGYVGLGLAVGLSRCYTVLGYDISEKRIAALKDNLDTNCLIDTETLAQSQILFTTNLQAIKEANLFIVAVSTPAFYYDLPDLEPLKNATHDVATVLKKGDIVIYESTVYPGTTDEVCIPILEEKSCLKSNLDFYVGYSPERISPGDELHTLKSIPKIISAQNKEALEIIKTIYQTCCETVYPVSSIKTAEAVKILENTQRDINIAFMNEFSMIMHALDLNVHEIIEAAKTKWSFIPFKPGFVGGHCIAVDPLYLAFKAKRMAVDCDLIFTARKINDNLTKFIGRELTKLFVYHQLNIKTAKIGIFGLTYKENIKDIRNTLSIKFINELKKAGFFCEVHDPIANADILEKKYAIKIKPFEEMNNLSVAILLVSHNYYKEKGFEAFIKKFNKNTIIFMDIPNLFIEQAMNHKNMVYWSL